MKQSEINILQSYFPFFKEDVDLKLIGTHGVIAEKDGVVITFGLTNAEYAILNPVTVNIGTSAVQIKPEGALSLDEHPKGTFDFEITYEDYLNSERTYHSDKCPFGTAFRRSFPKLFEAYCVSATTMQKSYYDYKNIATLKKGFDFSCYETLIETKQPFKTTITFL